MLKLKAPPKPGSKLRCPKCDGVFSPDGEPVESLASHDDDDELPPSRPKGRIAGKSPKKKSKPVNWQVPVLIGGIVVVLIAVGAGLFVLLKNLPSGPPSVDLAYCRLEQATMFAEMRPAEFLQSAAVPPNVKTAPAFVQTTASLKDLLGIEFGDVELIQAQAAVQGGFNPMQRGAAPADQLVVLKSKKPLTRPQSEQFDAEGVPCYYVHADPPDVNFQNTNTMFFADASTAVLGNESTIRSLLAKWKAKTPPAAAAFNSPGGTMVMYLGGDIVRQAVQSITSNPMLGMMGGPQGGLDADVKQTGEVLQTQAAGFSVSVNCAADISLSIAVHARDTSGAQQIQSQLEGLRTKLQEPLNQMEASLAQLPAAAVGQTREQLTLAKQVLATPVALAGDRVSLAIPLPAAQQATMLQGLTGSTPSRFSLKLGRGGASAAPVASPGQ